MTSAQASERGLHKTGEFVKRVLISLFGATADKVLIWYTGPFYVLLGLPAQTILKLIQNFPRHRRLTPLF